MTNLRVQDVVPSPKSYRFIPLTRGLWAVVDFSDFDWLNQRNWQAQKRMGEYYAVSGCREKKITMHNLILSTPVGSVGDHWNGDTLDNRRHNLRNTSQSENLLNRRCQRNNTSGIKGVFYLKNRGKWRATITRGGITYSNSSFATEPMAIAWRVEKELDIFGEYSRLMAPPCVDHPIIQAPVRIRPKGRSGKKYITFIQCDQSWRVRIPLDGRRAPAIQLRDLSRAVIVRNKLLLEHGLSIPD